MHFVFKSPSFLLGDRRIGCCIESTVVCASMRFPNLGRRLQISQGDSGSSILYVLLCVCSLSQPSYRSSTHIDPLVLALHLDIHGWRSSSSSSSSSSGGGDVVGFRPAIPVSHAPSDKVAEVHNNERKYDAEEGEDPEPHCALGFGIGQRQLLHVGGERIIDPR
ncbi:hypothetical protein K504DRAFT_91743 [Pleomassaria siparia CBS 279.74]|uniref:Uncharacterized protein n=1 Tax=Pleomassaria siparia CBS 279.74 TaxID=1314801 RepID=A0A6G1JYT1_9PLEO|nr:hypothetical protein K504DRAFT_91743 [Pleomassaria siparia CBS 279.74]